MLRSTWRSESDMFSGPEIGYRPVLLGGHLKERKLIGEFMKVVVDVTDLKKGLAFWSELTGLEPSFVDRAGRFMGLGNKMVLGEDSSVILLQLVDEFRPGGGTHIDIKVHDVEMAIQRIIEIGGTLKREPGLYPDAENPDLQWAVMQDPFGNPFCIIRYPV